MKHAIVIRMDYPESKEFRERLLLFRANMLARLQRQTDTNYEIWVRINGKLKRCDYHVLYKKLKKRLKP